MALGAAPLPLPLPGCAGAASTSLLRVCPMTPRQWAQPGGGGGGRGDGRSSLGPAVLGSLGRAGQVEPASAPRTATSSRSASSSRGTCNASSSRLRASPATGLSTKPQGSLRSHRQHVQLNSGSTSTHHRHPVMCRAGEASVEDDGWLQLADPYHVLGLTPGCDIEEVKVAFRAKIKEYHPDVYRGQADAQAITRRLILAYEVCPLTLGRYNRGKCQVLINDAMREGNARTERDEDVFARPEGAAEVIFINEFQCKGRACECSCVARAPSRFYFAADTGRARAYRGKAENADLQYNENLAIGQCPQQCIHYITPRQLSLLADLLQRAVNGLESYADVALTMEALVAKAKFENGRRPAPRRRAKGSDDQRVDWF